MSENVVDHIVESLRDSGPTYFPEHSVLKAVRVVGHTPKPEHYTYEIVLDFEDSSERVNAKVYRGGGKAGRTALQEAAKKEIRNLTFAYQALEPRNLAGVPRPLGDFSELGAVVSTKINGLPLQSIIMKAALLPDFGADGVLRTAASKAGEWLHKFHHATSALAVALDGDVFLAELEKLCAKARKDGLPAESTDAILANSKSTLNRNNKPMRSSAVLNDFAPLNVLVSESGVGFSDFANLNQRGNSLYDVAIFLAAVEALEKYPFCDRGITTLVQDAFLNAYGVSLAEQPLLAVMKVKVLLQMFAQGRTVKDSAVRKQVMWANVMKRFVQQAAERAMAPAA